MSNPVFFVFFFFFFVCLCVCGGRWGGGGVVTNNISVCHLLKILPKVLSIKILVKYSIGLYQISFFFPFQMRVGRVLNLSGF